jgi:phage terminase large subunit-like protein
MSTLAPERTAPLTQGGHFADFCREYLRHTKGRWAGNPVDLEPFQQDLMDEALKLDPETGRRVYNTVLVGLARKNGKSTIAAGLALYMLTADGEAGAEVIVAAGSRDQAAIVFDQARAFVESSPELVDYCDAQRYVIVGPEGGTIKRIAADGRLQHGLNPSCVIVDELHAFQTPRQEELYAALTTGSHAREEPLTFIITTAGYDRDTILGRLYDDAMRLADVERRGGLTIARNEAAGFLMWWFGVPDEHPVDDVGAWMDANPASWIDQDVLVRAKESPTIDELTFRRLHLNQWTKTREAWLPAGLWESLASDAAIPEGAEVYVGVDVGIVNDTTAVAVAYKLEDGRVVLRAKVWAARDGAVADVVLPGGRVDLTVIEDHVRAIAEKYQVREVVADPRFFERSLQVLADEGLTVAPIDQASRRMLEAYSGFYTACREGLVTHDGSQVLSRHVESTNATMTERGWKISRLRNHRIDACVASVMAHSRASRSHNNSYVLSWDDIEVPA